MRPQKVLNHSDNRIISDRIVSLYQAHLRPIVCGRARYNVEYGSQISVSVTGVGFILLNRLDFSLYNEGEDPMAQARGYRRRYGLCPDLICADRIYRTKASCAFCQRHGTRLSGIRLGLTSATEMAAESTRQSADDQRQRNAAKGKIRQRKRRSGFGLTCEKLAIIQGSSIVLTALVMSLEKLLELPVVLSPFVYSSSALMRGVKEPISSA